MGLVRRKVVCLDIGRITLKYLNFANYLASGALIYATLK